MDTISRKTENGRFDELSKERQIGVLRKFLVSRMNALIKIRDRYSRSVVEGAWNSELAIGANKQVQNIKRINYDEDQKEFSQERVGILTDVPIYKNGDDYRNPEITEGIKGVQLGMETNEQMQKTMQALERGIDPNSNLAKFLS